MVLGVLSILGIIALHRFLEVVQKTEKLLASNIIKSINIECESNNYFGGDLIFTPTNLKSYEFDNEGSNKCTGNEPFPILSIFPKDLKNQPSFLYDFASGELFCI